MGIHELLVVSPEVREIIRSQGASEVRIRQAARKEGFRTLLEDALEKMKQGLTSVEEVERVVVFAPGDKETPPPCAACGRALEPGWKACPFCANRSDGTPEPAGPRILPVAPPAASSSESLAGTKILLVDDEEETTRPLAVYLLKNKFSVTTAANGREALEAVAKDRPDILLTDVLMPEMDGLELVRRLRRDAGTSFLPVIVFSRKSDVADRLKGFEAGSDDYLPKPFDPEEMLQRVKAVLRRVRP